MLKHNKNKIKLKAFHNKKEDQVSDYKRQIKILYQISNNRKPKRIINKQKKL